jgi:hypothetical protein
MVPEVRELVWNPFQPGIIPISTVPSEVRFKVTGH